MARVTRAQIAQLFRVFCNSGGFKMSEGFKDPGLALNYYSYGGGYQIVEFKEGSSAEYEPFGGRRYSPKEFHAVLSFAVNVLGAVRQGYVPLASSPSRSNPVGRASFRSPFARRRRRR